MRAINSRVLSSLLLAGTLAVAASPALAQATAEEAARLQAIGETYFGKPAAGEPPTVTVTTEGDHYRASLDLGLLARRLIAFVPEDKRKDVSVEWNPMSVALAPHDGSNWRFWDYRVPKLTIRNGAQVTESGAEGIDFEVVTDPVTGIAPLIRGRMAAVTAKSTITESGVGVVAENTSRDLKVDGQVRATEAPGVVDAALHQAIGSFTYVVELDGGAAAKIPDMKFTFATGRRDDAIGLRGFRHAALLDLWAHLVAHHAPADFTTGQAALKAKIAAALPVFTDLTQKIAATDFAFESPFGVVKAAKATIDLDLAGLTRDGRVAAGFGVTGLEAYSLFMPKWARKLVPTEVALTGRADGYDLATPISAFLEAADFAAPQPLTPEQRMRIGALFLPRGTAEIVLDGNRLAAPLYDLALDGRLTAGPAGAKGAVTLRAKGIDQVADHLAGPDADDKQARTLAGVIAQARQFADRKGDELVWRFDFDGEHVAVNGRPLK